jgi:hypothetical protein
MCTSPLVARQMLGNIISLLSLLGNGLVNTFPQQWMHAKIELLDACICGSVCVTPLSLHGTNSVKTFPRQRRIFGGLVFRMFHVVSKESRQLVHIRTSCLRKRLLQTTDGRCEDTIILDLNEILCEVCTACCCLKLWSNIGHLWTRSRNCKFHKLAVDFKLSLATVSFSRKILLDLLPGEIDVLEEIPLNDTFSTTNPIWPDLGLSPGRRGGKPATNRLRYSTVSAPWC